MFVTSLNPCSSQNTVTVATIITTRTVAGVQAGEVETPAMAAEAGREMRRGAESDEESDGCNEFNEAQDSARVSLRVRNTIIHTYAYINIIISRKALPVAPRS